MEYQPSNPNWLTAAANVLLATMGNGNEDRNSKANYTPKLGWGHSKWENSHKSEKLRQTIKKKTNTRQYDNSNDRLVNPRIVALQVSALLATSVVIQQEKDK